MSVDLIRNAGSITRFGKAILLGLVATLLGITVGLSRFGIALEEDYGLDLFFTFRGERPAPPEVVVIALDKLSADRLNLPRNHTRWPRSYHARLVQNLIDAGASVITFDITFKDETNEDILFAQTIQKAGNVVLTEYLEKEIVPIFDPSGQMQSQMTIEKRIPPTPVLARQSAALTSFPLPSVPVTVTQFWIFKDGASDFPTTPVTAFQIYTLQVYDDLIALLRNVLTPPNTAPSQPDPSDRSAMMAQRLIGLTKEAVVADKNLPELIQGLKEVLGEKSLFADRMIHALENTNDPPLSVQRKTLVKALIQMYRKGDSRYINFYGPPGTITRVPYFQALQLPQKVVVNEKEVDFKGKAVFIGASEILPYQQKDAFRTPFAQSNGLDISGVEIAATAFANLLEDFPVRPLDFSFHLLILVICGLAMGMIWFLLPPAMAMGCTLGLVLLFLGYAYHAFKSAGAWFPVIVPIFFQIPFAGFGAVLWNYLDTNRERKIMREAFGYYLPNKVIDQLSLKTGGMKSGGQLVYGTILCTDIVDYTTLSELMDPEEMRKLINDYYEAICAPVKQHNGVVIDFKGDAMLAIWASADKDPALRVSACLAAPDIARAVDQFNQSSSHPKLLTRIGLHFGPVSLGNLGGGDRLDYTVIGDIVNTASRIEGLNKHFGTSIMASEKVLEGLSDFLTRDIGVFMLSGKVHAIGVHELIDRAENCNADQKRLCADFSLALDLYRTRKWPQAIEQFSKIRIGENPDRASLFYINLCKRIMENPPPEPWDGMIRFDKK